MTDLNSNMSSDEALELVFEAFQSADPVGARAARVFRSTFDQLYDGQHTGRYRWDQLYKTEKTHFGTLLEINLRREFKEIISDGLSLDFRVAGYEIDCKYSQRMNGWMLPPECVDQLLLVCNANDQASEWAMGIVRANDYRLNTGSNRDKKVTLNKDGTSAIRWLSWGAELPPNVLLNQSVETQNRIFEFKSGQARLNELFRSVMLQRIGRNTVATVAQQDDYMRRIRSSGGSRNALAPEGIVILGDYGSHQKVAEQLGLVVPGHGESVSARLAQANEGDPNTVELDGSLWRVALDSDPVVHAPQLPTTKAAGDR